MSDQGMQEIIRSLKIQLETWDSFGISTLPNNRSNSSGTKETGAATLESLKSQVLPCTKCADLAHNRTQVVFGVGNSKAELVFVGEAPGFDEDKQGEPFVGKAGHLLTKIIEAMGLRREEVYICNVLKCRPPQNRNPLPEEVANCEPYLKQQLAYLQPKVLVALGKFAAQTLLHTETPISRLRGKFQEYEGVPLMPTFHPAYLLRNGQDKKLVWEDMKQVMKLLGREVKK